MSREGGLAFLKLGGGWAACTLNRSLRVTFEPRVEGGDGRAFRYWENVASGADFGWKNIF